MKYTAIGGGTAIVVGLMMFGVNWFRETRAIVARSNRELEPWEVEARRAGLM